MTDARLTDVRWMDADIAAKLDEAGVTVASLAATTPRELLIDYPFVGTINAWLLTSEAAWLMNRLRAGLWSPSERVLTDDEAMPLLKELEQEQWRAIYGRPEIPNWPPEEPPGAPANMSVRVRRIAAQNQEEA